MTDLKNIENSVIVCEEKAPILRLLLQDNQSMWISTTDSTIKRWKIPKWIDLEEDNNLDLNDENSFKPKYSQPEYVIKGNPAIRKFHVLNDKRFILTKDSDNNIAIYDVLSANKVQDLGDCDFEEEIKRRFKMIYVPNWFSVDLKSGMLSIHLEEPDCFSAWVSSKEFGLTETTETKLNLGCLVLESLLDNWAQSQQNGKKNGNLDEQERIVTSENSLANNSHFKMPGHTPVIFNENTRPVLRITIEDAKKDLEDSLLQESVPDWIKDIVIYKHIPNPNKVSYIFVKNKFFKISNQLLSSFFDFITILQ